jgi:hypothetical protein
MEDQDLAGIDHYLEAIDDAGRAALEKVRAKVEAPSRFTAVADLDSGTVEFLARALRPAVRIETTYAENRDGTTSVSTKVYPANPLPGADYDDNGRLLSWDTARRRKREEMERTLAAVLAGAKKGGKRARATKRDKAARRDKALLTAVQAERKKHPSHSLPAIAAALVDKYSRKRDHADPRDRQKAVEALRKRIERLEKKSLDR